METYLLLLVLVSSIWVFVDTKGIGVKNGQMKGLADLGPGG